MSLPDDYMGLPIDGLSARMRADHNTTLLAVTRDGRAQVNPPVDLVLESGDAMVVAESISTLAPLHLNPLRATTH